MGQIVTAVDPNEVTRWLGGRNQGFPVLAWVRRADFGMR